MSFEKRLFVLFTFNKDSVDSFTLDSFYYRSLTLMSISLLFLLLIWKKYWVFSFDFLSKEDLLLSTLAKSQSYIGSFPLLKLNFKADPISKVTFHFGSFTLLKPNFKADPISKVPLLPSLRFIRT
ncbi:unnamed protein product [Rhizophagus irregularis]|nr:unnamed protein product [Rhizophagus irregularis]